MDHTKSYEDKINLTAGSMLYKHASLNPDVKLYPHQEKVKDRPGKALIIAHAVGSGKTLSAIARFERLKGQGKAKKALVIVPASLRNNFANDGVKKFTDSSVNIIGNQGEIKKGTAFMVDPNSDYNVISYEMFRKNPEKYIEESGADVIISDESHRGKNENTKTTDSLKSVRGKGKQYIGMTGSVISNRIADIQPLVDVASGGDHLLGKNKKEFDKRYLKRSDSAAYDDMNPDFRPIVGLKNKKILRNELGKYVDYLDPDDIKDTANMPTKDLKVVKVPISKEQAEYYKKILKNNPELRKTIIERRLETLKDEEAAKSYSQLIEARKLMNSLSTADASVKLSDSPEVTPKTKKLLDDMDDHLKETKDGRALLFSHLITGGTDVLEQGLKNRKIPYGKFTGKGNKGITEESRQQAVEDFNAGKNKVMVISSAGGEGLSLKDTTWEGVLDPHYNPEKMKQMEARGIRSGGLSNRPKEERKVAVNRYLATMPKGLGIFPSRYKTPDEIIYTIAKNKDKTNQYLFDLLKENQKRKVVEAKPGTRVRKVPVKWETGPRDKASSAQPSQYAMSDDEKRRILDGIKNEQPKPKQSNMSDDEKRRILDGIRNEYKQSAMANPKRQERRAQLRAIKQQGY